MRPIQGSKVVLRSVQERRAPYAILDAVFASIQDCEPVAHPGRSSFPSDAWQGGVCGLVPGGERPGVDNPLAWHTGHEAHPGLCALPPAVS